MRHIGLVDEALACLDRSRRAIAERRLELAFDHEADADRGMVVQRSGYTRRVLDQVHRLPDVRVTHDDVPPFTAGTRNPTLVLPLWLCAPGPQLHAVLLHELAHLERGDQHVIWLERLVTSLFFFWPPVHWVTHKLHEARELACDERAIERGAFAAPDYAEHLLDVVARTRGHAAHEAPAIGRTAQRLERRIDRLLESARSHHPSARHAAVLLALLLTARVGFRPELPPPLAAAAPEPVFGDCAKLTAALANDTCNDGSCPLQCGP